MAFVTKIDATADRNRRSSERRLTNFVSAAISGRGAPLTIIVHDISETGFRAEFASEFRVGDAVRLRLGRGDYADATVVWRDGWEHGCRFVTPIPAEDVRIAAESLTQVVAPEDEEAALPASAGEDDTAGAARRPRKGRRLMLLIVAAVVLGELYLLVKMLL